MSHAVPIATFSSLPEAQVAKTFLSSHGIDSLVMDEHTVGMNVWLTQAIGGIRLMVHVDDSIQAHQLLSEADANELETEVSWGSCPRCDAEEVEVLPYSTMGQALTATATVALTGMPMMSSTHSLRCNECGHNWQLAGKGS
ncbi:MAG: hypothetical protein CL920_18060 [Deltaproteobacteria bacterium]|nr:hypothetical protein [Deltaproteobacteria bacterium]|tara:strand:- start:26799 stop:27221 length:423 start_codon:yes stop_codon:yes gene_type:complete